MAKKKRNQFKSPRLNQSIENFCSHIDTILTLGESGRLSKSVSDSFGSMIVSLASDAYIAGRMDHIEEMRKARTAAKKKGVEP